MGKKYKEYKEYKEYKWYYKIFLAMEVVALLVLPGLVLDITTIVNERSMTIGYEEDEGIA